MLFIKKNKKNSLEKDYKFFKNNNFLTANNPTIIVNLHYKIIYFICKKFGGVQIWQRFRKD